MTQDPFDVPATGPVVDKAPARPGPPDAGISVGPRLQNCVDTGTRTVQLNATPRVGRAKVLTILWDPHRPGIDAPPKDAITNLLHGSQGSVAEWLLQNSGGSFSIENAGVLGWYDADFAPEEYWPGGGKPGRDGGTEAIRKAMRDLDFTTLDADGDGKLETDEVGLLFILPGV